MYGIRVGYGLWVAHRVGAGVDASHTAVRIKSTSINDVREAMDHETVVSRSSARGGEEARGASAGRWTILKF